MIAAGHFAKAGTDVLLFKVSAVRPVAPGMVVEIECSRRCEETSDGVRWSRDLVLTLPGDAMLAKSIKVMDTLKFTVEKVVPT